MSKLLREPLVHFVLIGIALFIGHNVWIKWVSNQDYVIEIPLDEIERQANIFGSDNSRIPTEEDKMSLLLAHVEEEVLMREAIRLGLDKDDTIVRRQLAQKMRMRLTENSPPALPDEAVLKDWYETHKDRFIKPSEIAFTHIYFSPAEYSDVEETALETLSLVTNDNWKTLGDPFIEANQTQLMDEITTSRRFGPKFAADLFRLPNSSSDAATWQGPLSSAFGMHLVRIDRKNERQAPSFDSHRAEIETAWQDETLRAENIQRLEDTLAKYKVEIIE